MVAALVYADDSVPLEWWIHSALWLALLALLSFLMVSTWRYPSFKEINLKGPRSPLTVVFFGVIIYLIWNYSQPVLLTLATLYVSTGMLLRGAGIIRRRFRPHHPPPPQPHPEHQTS
jgi:CDP-diacylglycerol--serine O-phosphatidyltransferase